MGAPQTCLEGIVTKREIRHGWWYFEVEAGGHAFHCVDMRGNTDPFGIYPGRPVRFYGNLSAEIVNYFEIERTEYLDRRVQPRIPAAAARAGIAGR